MYFNSQNCIQMLPCLGGFNKMADLPEDPYAVFRMSGPPSSPPISPFSKYAF